jgi:crotonobetainyl-CoA:carnitine CoA-transferase CaiB-like acyl-CoA transferase
MVVIAVGNDGQFRALAKALGVEPIGVDARFATNASRVQNRVELARALSALTAGFTMKGLMAVLEAAGVPCGPVNTIDQVFEEPQALHRRLEIDLPRDDLSAPTKTVASPIRLSKTPVRYDSAPPRLGADTDEVLASLKA